MKKIFIFLLLIILMAINASAYDFMVDGLCYNINEDGVSVTVTYQSTSNPRYPSLSGTVTIPPSVSYDNKSYSVTGIGSFAFHECTGLTSITIPNSVTTIGYRAFLSCTGLTSITIPNSVTKIDDIAFWYCTGLTSVTIGNSVTYIGSSAFEHCTGLTSITIPKSVTFIGYRAFENCI